MDHPTRSEGDEDDDEYEEAKKKGASVGDGVDDGIFVEEASGGLEPEAAEPQKEDRDEQPEAVGVLVELCGCEVGDVEREDGD
jgi:hypothetical protein